MSFPYQYVDYSNPATPRVYSWDVPSEQDALQMQQQEQHDQAALQQQQHLQQQHQQQQIEQPQQQQQQQERVSPSQLQLQQLPPPPPPPLLTPQDVQHHHQQQHPQQQRTQYTPHPQTISLQPAKSQPQYRFDNITEDHVAPSLFLIYAASHDPETTPTATTHARAHALHAEPMRRYSIRADIHYNTEENFIIAVFELPGVKRQDLRITMSMCPLTRVRQVNIAGISRPAVPMHGHGVRERKYGQFMRTLPVPPETKPEDVQISLEDGVLTLKIPGGTPAQAEDRHILAIP
ncbi:hypothetical protein BN946_scf184774.g4 [Trametes cinnabarina]|uniref:SHSP domain-containing protein n=1 Tax=Pycnoporus cinnabarinus TaxID=5643 RepID=A0A060S7F8_PYCCI|nr:hypothetical protein BN946_scf184774.g4 [Trametes cinnabarina]